MRIGGQCGLMNLLLYANVKVAGGIGLAPHSFIGGRGFGGVLALAGALLESLPHQALMICGRHPGSAQLLPETRAAGFELPVDVLHLLVNFEHAREVGAAFDAELGKLLLEAAPLGVKLAECAGKIVGLRSYTGIERQHYFGVALCGGSKLGFAQQALRFCGCQCPAQFIDGHNGGEMARGGGNTIRQRLRRDEYAVLLLKDGQSAVVFVYPGLEASESVIKAADSLPGGLGAILRQLPGVGGNQGIYHIGGKAGVARTEADFHQQRSRHGAHLEAVLEALQQPGLGVGGGGLGPEAGKPRRKAAHYGLRGIELAVENHLPGQPVAAQDAGNRFGLHHGGGFRRGRLWFRAI